MSITQEAPVKATTKPLTSMRALMQAAGIGSNAALEVNSSAIGEARYVRGERKLVIRFNSGAAYEYGSVPASVYRDFARSDSKGRFFVNNIRNNFPMRKLSI